MPLLALDGFRCHYRLDGPDDRPVLVLAHSLGLDLGLWDQPAALLSPHLRVLRYDLRGHGASGVTAGEYTIERLGRDVLALVDALGIDRFAFCGLSIGGMVGQWLGAMAAPRLTHLILANTSPRVADPASMETRRTVVLAQGMAPVVETALARFFSPAFLARDPPAVTWARRTLAATSPVGYAGACAAVRDMDLRDAVRSIAVPTLVISGDLDVSMPWAQHGAVLAEAIAGARAVRLPAAHLSSLELPTTFTTALASLLLPPAADPVAAGLAVRRAVLGHAHVDRALLSATEFTRAFQQLVTTVAWGTIWTRPGLDHRTRRMLVLAMTAALGRWEEFRLHLGAAVSGGMEWAEVEEVLLQVAVYAGVPAANTAFHLAADERAARMAPPA